MEFARRSGDYALVGAAAVVTPALDGRCLSAQLAFLGISGYPIRAREVEQLLVGTTPDDQTLDNAAELAQALVGEDMADVHASVNYRRKLTAELTRRVLKAAWERRGH